MKTYFLLIVLLISGLPVHAQMTGEVTVEHNGRPNTVVYNLFIHEKLKGEKNLPVIVCTGGVPMRDGKYETSSPTDCLNDEWKKTALKSKAAILGLGFLFVEDDWEMRQTYQFPYFWSGKALDDILSKISADNVVNPNSLLLYGVSGGAQFSVRYALLNPYRVVAVAAHAAGSYEPPMRNVGTDFLITVGEMDNEEVRRKDMAVEFTESLKLFGTPVRLEIIEGIAHRQTEKQDDMSRKFFAEHLNRRNESKSFFTEQASLAIGSGRERVFEQLKEQKIFTHRRDGNNAFRTYSYGPANDQMLTLHFIDDVLINWGLNARSEVVDEYLTEFVTGGIIRSYPKTFQAIRNALIKLPQEPLMKVIDRERPVIFLDVTTGGIARYANAVDFYFREDDPPALSRGFYLIKLGRDLEDADSVEAIEGIIFHELTHHILDHLRGPVDCDTEREANRLVKEWGFVEELKKASGRFGAKNPEDSPCYEVNIKNQ